MQKDYHATTAAAKHQTETEHIAEHWTQAWRTYAAKGGVAAHVADKEMYRLMAPFLRELPKGASILDGGCGMGEWTSFLAEQGFDVTGIDLSTPTVDLLHKNIPERKFMEGDIRTLPFADNSFATYFSWGTFEHFEDGLGKPINEALRVLKPGGLLFITVPFQNVRHQFRGAPKIPASNNPRFYQWRLTPRELREELAMRGFSVRMIRPISKDQGARRMVTVDLGFPKTGVATKIATKLALLALPSVWIAHMLFAVAQKPQ